MKPARERAINVDVKTGPDDLKWPPGSEHPKYITVMWSKQCDYPHKLVVATMADQCLVHKCQCLI